MAILFASLSLVFAGVNDLVFKRYRSAGGTLGFFFTVAGAIMLILFLARGLVRGGLAFDGDTVLWGSVAGILSASANLLLVWAMKETGAGLSATLYRLNLVWVALMAFFILGESFGPLKVLALAVAVGAVVLFSLGDGASPRPKRLLLLALVGASLLRAAMGITYKWASLTGVHEDAFLALGGFWWFVFGLFALVRTRPASPFSNGAWKLPVLSGLLITGIVLFMKLAVNLGDAGVVVTITQFSFLITFPLSVLFFKESLTKSKAMGLALAVGSIALLSLSGTR